jgi:hypothetical protein
VFSLWRDFFAEASNALALTRGAATVVMNQTRDPRRRRVQRLLDGRLGGRRFPDLDRTDNPFTKDDSDAIR